MAKCVSEETYFNGCLKHDSYFSQNNWIKRWIKN